MPVDTIKFDTSLIQGMKDKRLCHLVEEMAAMLLRLKYKLVAEGIEDEAMLERVKKADFDCSQGFFLGQAVRKT